ncbi:hypothetical protein [Sphingopyxis sp. PET50]|uniref:hypothetical protein n=1 Tax=Sphingopyxis sp. PET50 TaxID=2976533 RepID=UPI0021AE3528|nr:hypothetical protein [Sphingopyxis sp. PET50]
MSVPRYDLLGEPLTILILSPQPWAGLQVSKHHYARELAALGHRVFFLNPPGGSAAITVSPSETPGVMVVEHPELPFARLKFRARWLFDRITPLRAAAIARAIGPIDLLWDFDNARQFADHRPFGAGRSILHLVDHISTGVPSHRHADLILAVDALFLQGIPDAGQPRHVIGHGLAPWFAEAARRRLGSATRRSPDKPPVVGFVGNFAQAALDRPRVMGLVTGNPDIAFRFIGPTQGGMSAELLRMQAWVEELRLQPNVALPGLLTGQALIDATADVDVWLLCYDRELDPNHGVNSHKLLEYFATGGEVVSSHILAQANAPGIFMAPADAPDRIAQCLSEALTAVREGRDTGWRQRIELALANSYASNLRQIAAHLSALDRSG